MVWMHDVEVRRNETATKWNFNASVTLTQIPPYICFHEFTLFQMMLIPTPPVSPRPSSILRLDDVNTPNGTSSTTSVLPPSAVSTAPTSPRTPLTSRSGSINAQRRTLFESQLNAQYYPSPKLNGNNSQVGSPRSSSSASSNSFHFLSPPPLITPMEIPPAVILPVSKPITNISPHVTPRPRSRRNSWIIDNDTSNIPLLSTNEPDGIESIIVVQTEVEPLTPTQTASSPPPTHENASISTLPIAVPVPVTVPLPLADSNMSSHSVEGSHPVFASEEAAKKYARMLRRASWPLVMPQITPTVVTDQHQTGDTSSVSIPAIESRYHATPLSSPRGLAQRARHPIEEEELHFDKLDESNSTSLPLSPPLPSPSPIQSPLVNLLLLGDETCGLGAALDEFAGRDHNVGLTFKTRKIHLRRPTTNDIPTDASSIGTNEDEVYRVRCWHTPGLTPENTRSLTPYLRHVQAVALIYDADNVSSFKVVEAWASLLLHAQQQEAASSATGTVRQRPVLLIGNTAHVKNHESIHALDAHAVRDIDAAAAAAAAVAASSSNGSSVVSDPSLTHTAEEPSTIAAAAAVAASSISPSLVTRLTSQQRSRRRSSLPHPHMPSLLSTQHGGPVAALPIGGIAPVESIVTGSGSSNTINSAGTLSNFHIPPRPHSPVSPAHVSALLHRLSSSPHVGDTGLVCALRLNANLWKERYRAFYTLAALVQHIGSAQLHSRPVSPVPIQQ
jgi:hypothetical protein